MRTADCSRMPNERLNQSGIPFHMPNEQERTARIGSVLHVLYLIFNEGYTPSSIGPELLSDRSARMKPSGSRDPFTSDCFPDVSEVAGLLALMLLTDARRPATKRAQRRIDSCLRNKIEIGSCGIARTSPRESRSSAQPFPRVRSVHISSRPPSRRFTTRRRTPRKPIGRRFWLFTDC